MLKKVTTVISQNKDAIRQKALVLGGITTGMLISAVLAKTSEPDVVVIQTTEDETVVTDAKPEATPTEG